MASIKKRPDGRYRARYRDPDGREHARHFVLRRTPSAGSTRSGATWWPVRMSIPMPAAARSGPTPSTGKRARPHPPGRRRGARRHCASACPFDEGGRGVTVPELHHAGHDAPCV